MALLHTFHFQAANPTNGVDFPADITVVVVAVWCVCTQTYVMSVCVRALVRVRETETVGGRGEEGGAERERGRERERARWREAVYFLATCFVAAQRVP